MSAASAPPIARRLSVCMIVRDEAERLGACLESVRHVADELVVVDTGSRDDTRRIALDAGAVVADHPWNDDYGTARNAALELATGDWILSLDADQRLDAGSAGELRRIVATSAPALYLLRQINYANGESVENLTGRLFPNHPAVRYRGRIHEQIVSSSAALTLVHVPCDIVVHHIGYDGGLDREKARRYVPMIEAQVAEEPHQPFHLYNLGVAHLTLEDHAAAEHALRRTLDLAFSTLAPSEQPTYLVHARALLAVALLGQRRTAEAAAVCRAAVAVAPNLADAWCTLGAAELRRGHATQALDAYCRASTCEPGRHLTTHDRNASGWKATLGMGEASLALRRWPDAIARLERVAEQVPGSAELARAVHAGIEAAPLVAGFHRLQARLHAHREDLDQALRSVERALVLDDADAGTLTLAAELLRKAGAEHEAESARLAAQAVATTVARPRRPRVLFVTCFDPAAAAPMGFMQRLSLHIEAMREIADVEFFRPTPEVGATGAPSATAAAQAMEDASSAAAAHGALQTRRATSLNAAAFAARAPQSFDIVFLHRLCTAWWTGWTDPHRAIVDVDDLPSRTTERAAAIGGPMARTLGRLQHARVRRSERKLCEAFRAVVVTSEDDRDYLDHPHAAIVPNAYRPHPLMDEPVTAGDGRAMVFVGTLTFQPNVDGMAWFVREVLPRVHDEVPAAFVTVIGFEPAVRTGDWTWTEVSGVRFLGGVRDAGAHVHAASLAVCPLHFGRGTRIKIIEALAFGTPVVSTAIGAFGLPFSEREGVVRRDGAAAFAAACVTLLRDPVARLELGKVGRAAAFARRSPAGAKAALQALARAILSERGFAEAPTARGRAPSR